MTIDVTVLLTSSVIVSAISLIGSLVMFKLNRNSVLEDRKDEVKEQISALQETVSELLAEQAVLANRIKELSEQIADLKESQKIILQNEILYKIKKAMKEGRVSHDEKSTIISMHSIYHNKLGGNGQLDASMSDLSSLDVIY